MADGSARISFAWGDGETYEFRLALKQLRELQDKTGVGPFALYTRLAGKDWRVDDLRQTIRLGLLGGGMDPMKAAKLVENYVDDRPLLESVGPSLLILQAALTGADGDDPGKKTVAGESPAETDSPSQT